MKATHSHSAERVCWPWICDTHYRLWHCWMTLPQSGVSASPCCPCPCAETHTQQSMKFSERQDYTVWKILKVGLHKKRRYQCYKVMWVLHLAVLVLVLKHIHNEAWSSPEDRTTQCENFWKLDNKRNDTATKQCECFTLLSLSLCWNTYATKCEVLRKTGLHSVKISETGLQEKWHCNKSGASASLCCPYLCANTKNMGPQKWGKRFTLWSRHLQVLPVRTRKMTRNINGPLCMSAVTNNGAGPVSSFKNTGCVLLQDQKCYTLHSVGIKVLQLFANFASLPYIYV